MTYKDALAILAKHRYRDCPRWLANTYGDDSEYIIGYDASGKSTGSFTVFEAIAIAEKLQQESMRSAYQERAGNSPKNSDGLGSLEWRKQVDKQLEAVAFTRDCHNDRFFRDEKQLQDHDYRITAWGECVSDALKKIVAQDERIAKLEADIDRIVKLGCGIESDQEESKGRIEKLEADVSRHDENIIYLGGQTAENGTKVYALKEQIANLEATLGEFEAVATVEEVGEEIDLLGGRITAIESRINFQNSVTFKVIDNEHKKLNSRIDKTVEAEIFDDLEKRVTGLERRLVNAYLSGKI